MKKMVISRKIHNQEVLFKSFEDEKGIQIQMEVPNVLQVSVCDWKLHPKWMFIVDTQINSIYDKHKVFTMWYFEEFVNKFMRYISRNKEIAELLVSGETKINYLLGRHHRLDALINSELFSTLTSTYNFNKRVEKHSWGWKLK